MSSFLRSTLYARARAEEGPATHHLVQYFNSGDMIEAVPFKSIRSFGVGKLAPWNSTASAGRSQVSGPYAWVRGGVRPTKLLPYVADPGRREAAEVAIVMALEQLAKPKEDRSAFSEEVSFRGWSDVHGKSWPWARMSLCIPTCVGPRANGQSPPVPVLPAGWGGGGTQEEACGVGGRTADL